MLYSARRVLRTGPVSGDDQRAGDSHAAKAIKLPSIRQRNRKSWTSEEARAFLESARADDDPLYAAYVLVLVLGLRKDEVLGLGWDRIDVEAGEASVDWQLQRIGRTLVRRATKTEQSEPTLPYCRFALRLWGIGARFAARFKDKAGAAWHSLPCVFTTGYGTPIEPRNFNRFGDRRCAAGGIRPITVHDTRRTCGTLLADLEVHPRVAMQILRYAQFSITMEFYTQVFSKATREALRRLGKSLDG